MGCRSHRRPVGIQSPVQLKCDGTRWRTGEEVKGKLANRVGSQYSSHYLGTWCGQHYYRWCAHLGYLQWTRLYQEEVGAVDVINPTAKDSACINQRLPHIITPWSAPILKSVYANFTFMWPCIVTNFLTMNHLDALFSQIYFGMKLYTFRTVPLSIIRSYSLYTQQWHMSYSCSILILLLESCLQTCMAYTIAECTVNNSWWWTRELSETCRVSFQNKFEKLVRLVGFIKRNQWM
jgi:hypothetical protein